MSNEDQTAKSPVASVESFGEWLFAMRDYTPIPLILLVLFTCEPTVISATIGTLMVVFGELIRVYSVAFIGSVSRTRNTETTGNNLIDTGPYGWVRNPLYVGNFFITTGIAIYGGVVPVVMITIVAFALQYHAIVKHEESLLVRSFGDSYKDYMVRVPAWFPKKIEAPTRWEWPTTFSGAMKSEKRTVTAITVMLLAMMTVHFIWGQ